jgi:hypothetical protein
MWLPLVAVLLTACTTMPYVASDYDKSSQFSNFHKFTLIVRPHPSMHGSPLVEQRTYDAIGQELTSKGFTYVPDAAQADFAVDFSIGAQDRLDLRSYPRAGPWGAGLWGNDIDLRQYQEGTLAVDVFAVRSGRAVWHGSAEGELLPSEMQHSETPIREAVTAVLANFPPKFTLTKGQSEGPPVARQVQTVRWRCDSSDAPGADHRVAAVCADAAMADFAMRRTSARSQP